MKKDIYCRIGGHLLILFFLTEPLTDLEKVEKHKDTNQDVKVLAGMRTRFATIWNVVFQIMYATLALVLDVSTLLKKRYNILSILRNYRNIFFAGIIFPVVCGVQMFWAVYFYDRELVYKSTIQEVISQKVNFIVHTVVLIYALWELIFLPKDEPKKNDASWKLLHIFNIAYVFTTFYTRYVDVGIWPYIVLEATTGTVMFPVILVSIWALSTIGYYLQWHIKSYAWYLRETMYTNKNEFK